MVTYVAKGDMLDGRTIADLIDKGIYKPGPRYINFHDAGYVIDEHLLCSDMSSIKDVNTTDKWKRRKSQIKLSQDIGTLFELDDETYLYATTYGLLTRLSHIQDALVRHFNEAFELHWSACRSIVPLETSVVSKRFYLVDQCTSDLARPFNIWPNLSRFR